MSEMKWKWAYGPYLDPPEGQRESALKAGYIKVVSKQSADEAIAELKEERRWRKCSEEMPEDGAEVLASDGDGIWLCYKTTMCDGSPWFQPDGLPHIEGITHWMPLPKMPKEADK